MYQNDAQKCLTGEVRLSYLNATTPRASQQGGDPKYSVTLLIPKTDAATVADINSAIQAAAQEALSKTWGGVRPPQLPIPLHDGDGVRQSGLPFGDECKGHYVITASSKNKPQVVGADNINVELSPSDIYSGMHGRVTIRFFGYNSNGKKGIGCGLGNIMKTRDDEPLAGGASAASDFSTVGNSVMPATAGYAAPGYTAPGYAAPGYTAPGYAAPGYAAPGYAAAPVPPVTPQTAFNPYISDGNPPF